MDEGLVYKGKIIDIQPIKGADFIVAATVVCGIGGKWKGVIRKDQFSLGSPCIVYLPDSIIPPREDLQFMESKNWRISMCRFKGSPSEVLITCSPSDNTTPIGTDLTEFYRVKKYHKPLPGNLIGKAKSIFPGFIPRTDELNYQRHPELVEALHGKEY